MAAKTIMTLTAPRDAWTAMLAAAGRVANPKPIPVLACVRLEADAAGLVGWWVTDTQVSRGGLIAATADRPGVALLPVSTALAMIKSCADGLVQVAFTESGDALVKAGSFSARIPGFTVEDFPLRPDVEPVGVPVPRETLARLVAEVRPSVDGSSSRYYLRGALFQIAGTSALAVSTDGHQLSRSSATLSWPAAAAVDAIVPYEALGHLAAMLEETAVADVLYSSSLAGHVFQAGADFLTARPVEGTFPAWERVLPKTTKGRVECDRDALSAAMKRVAVSSYGVARVQMRFGGDALRLSARSVEKGDSEDLVQADVDGPDVTCIFNARYVQNFLGTVQTERIAVEYTSADTVVLFRPVGGDASTDYLHAVMTMRDSGDHR
jgi:DNA polymerase-3 subunit beta